MAEISGQGIPTTQTAAAVGDIYTDTDTGQKYKCGLAYASKDEKGNDFTYYIWTKLKNESSGSGGTTDYTNLTNKPQINNVDLVGNKTSADLSLLDEAAVNSLIDTKLMVIDPYIDDIKENTEHIGNLKEDLSNKITKFYASNQGETHITDSDNGKIEDTVLYGKSKQKRYKGINLFPPDTKNREYVEVSIPKGTFVFWTTDGTPTNGGNFRFFNEDKTESMWFGIDSSTTSKRTTLTIDAKYVQNLINTDFDLSKICLGIGNEVIYEPYTGGIPSPSLDYPQEIKSVVNPTVKVSNEDGTKSQTVTLPYTLNAMPVSSGGNVTIDGQQYIADYVDVERGKLVRMVDTLHPKLASDTSVYTGVKEHVTNYRTNAKGADKKNILSNMLLQNSVLWSKDVCGVNVVEYDTVDFSLPYEKLGINSSATARQREIAVKAWLENNDLMFMYIRRTSNEIDLAPEEVQAFKALATYYPVTNISVNSGQLDGYTVFNYPISMQNGWNYVKQQLGDTRDYIYDMDAKAQDIDIQSAEAYVNSEYAVVLTELEV